MTQYHYLDESGDPGLDGAKGSSSHFALAMVQLSKRAPLSELATVRRMLYLAPMFEFKYHKAKPTQKEVFFASIQAIPFRVRAAVVDKSSLGQRFGNVRGQDLLVEFISHLILRSLELDIANDVLVIDGATPLLRRALRIKLSRECRELGRVRPFKKIIGGDSRREDGIQLADMVVGAVRHHVMGIESIYYQAFADKVVDLWSVPTSRK